MLSENGGNSETGYFHFYPGRPLKPFFMSLCLLQSLCGCALVPQSDSLQPHRRQPTRLPRPWDSPGKNTGVGCHFLLQCVKVKNESEVEQLYPTLNDPMDYSLPGSSVHGIFQARVLERGAIAFSDFMITCKRKDSREGE